MAIKLKTTTDIFTNVTTTPAQRKKATAAIVGGAALTGAGIALLAAKVSLVAGAALTGLGGLVLLVALLYLGHRLYTAYQISKLFNDQKCNAIAPLLKMTPTDVEERFFSQKPKKKPRTPPPPAPKPTARDEAQWVAESRARQPRGSTAQQKNPSEEGMLTEMDEQNMALDSSRNVLASSLSSLEGDALKKAFGIPNS